MPGRAHGGQTAGKTPKHPHTTNEKQSDITNEKTERKREEELEFMIHVR